MKTLISSTEGLLFVIFTYGSILTLASEVQGIPFTGTSTDSCNHRNRTF